MKQVKKPGKRQLGMLILAGLLLLSVVLYIVISALSSEKPEDKKKTKYDPLPGESEDGKVYPVINTDKINWVSVTGSDNEHTYDLLKDSEGSFILYYTDKDGEKQVYYPDICAADPSFSYTSLYAADAFGQGKIARILYLKQGLSSLAFGERIAITDENRATLLAEYGFDKNTTTVRLRYETGSGVESHKITVGGTLISKNGYYLMIDDRPYVYSVENTMLDYAMKPFAFYINPRLVSEGLSTDGVYEPYLTTMYRQWKRTLHDGTDEAIPADAEVILRALMKAPYVPGSADGTPGADGYLLSPEATRSFDLSVLGKNDAYARLVAALTGRTAGTLPAPLSVSVVTGPRAVKIPDGLPTHFTYTIRAIEAILTENGEITDKDYPVLSHDLLKVTYTYTENGGEASSPTHGILDLSDANLPADAVTKLRAMKIGTLQNESDFVTFDLHYTAENANARRVKIVLTEIMSIYNSDASTTEDVAADGSLVSYRYRFVIDGKTQEKEYSVTVKLTESLGEIYTKLLGQKAGKNLSLELASYTEYGEVMKDFVTYEITSVSYFVTKEEVVAFRFLNSSERDPFYGESIYENLTEGRRRLYGLSATNCEGTVKFLGGVGGNTSLSSGLVGAETVAVGLTPEIMKQYGLYAYTIYFELPRGISSVSSDENDENDDYTWLDTLGFTLYISERQADGSRYMASDLYGTVVRIEEEDLRFLEYDFTEYWARQTLLLLDVKDLSAFDVEFFMEDLKGKYGFQLKHTTYYVTPEGKGYLSPPSSGQYTEYDMIEVSVTPTGDDATDNLLLSYLRSLGTNTVSLKDFYDATLGGGEPIKVRNDTAGTAYFKEVLQILYQIPYSGRLTEEEQATLLPAAAKLMKFSLKLKGSAYRYAFEFYRLDDRRIAVRMYRETEGGVASGEVTDFTVSAFSFKKMTYAFVSLLNGKVVDGDTAYGD